MQYTYMYVGWQTMLGNQENTQSRKDCPKSQSVTSNKHKTSADSSENTSALHYIRNAPEHKMATAHFLQSWHTSVTLTLCNCHSDVTQLIYYAPTDASVLCCCLWNISMVLKNLSAFEDVADHFISRVLQSLWMPAIWLHHYPLREVGSVRLQILLTMVCRWPQSQEGNLARPHLCKFAWHRPWPVCKWFNRDHVRWERSKPGCRIVGSITMVWLTAEA